MTDAGQVRVNAFVESQIDHLASKVEEKLDAHVMAVFGPLIPGIDDSVRQAIEMRQEPGKKKLAVVLYTSGGIREVVERIVKVIRHHYEEVTMIVPDQAMSAGTVFAMACDAIMMDYFSCLGPIDPQIERNGKLVPALSYLVQFERLKKQSEEGILTTAEMLLLQQLDLAELHSFEEARELSIALLKEWLAKYKFKDWAKTESRGIPVTQELREQRAVDIAKALIDHERWHSHGRPICMEVLRKEINLKIDDFGDNVDLGRCIRDYYQFLVDYMRKMGIYGVVHTKGSCLKLG